MISPAPPRRMLALGAAGVWLHQGLWCKVLGRDPAHLEILAGLPGVGRRRARAATTALGLAETALGVLVARRGDQMRVAGLQTGLILAFNAGGLVVGRAHIDRPARILVRNGLIVALIWSAVDGQHRR